MAKKGNKKNTEKKVKKEMKEEEKTVAPIQQEKKEVPKEEPACTEKECCAAETCCTKCCCCKSCGCCCCPLRLFLLAVVLTIGFVFYLIVRDDPAVTVELCKTDIAGCFNGVVKAVRPYTNPYKMIDYLRAHGYVN
ncbi:hypothetical protein AV274_1472 [Blastocystis sp. ATCC 50177/Nand II]|uniref:Transmembrane protein n=1 Tax=Blastocystis sp. subtype 1 (strain ATCC 50177 / NandII) TaxID=478820 RepID=A0A196SKT6_BLAHN|nr:hypothetical protein AV274_1472 [Blastocystis sp. ATCC 50177/Nand II]